ncbi:MAG: OB-fold putative lipoprotein [Chitinophagaceae bacterium]|nr:OB-fold putative lipoprotein [Chitinophagaceae bacterium]
MRKKWFLGAFIVFVTAILGLWFFIFYKPTHFKRNPANEKGIVISAPAIVKAYLENEAAANLAYLDKSVEIKGEITEIKSDQSGNTIITLKSDDAMAGVLCTLKAPDNSRKVANIITVKGICTGFLSDVVLKDATIIQ